MNKIYYTDKDPQTGIDLKTTIECFPAIVTDDYMYNCEFCECIDCKHYEEIMQAEKQNLEDVA